MKILAISRPPDTKIRNFDLYLNHYEINDNKYTHNFKECLKNMKGYRYLDLKDHIILYIFYESDIIK